MRLGLLMRRMALDWSVIDTVALIYLQLIKDSL